MNREPHVSGVGYTDYKDADDDNIANEKKDIYRDSNLRMARFMVGNFGVAEETDKSKSQYQEIVSDVPCFEHFDIDSISKKEKMYLSLAKKIWYLPHK